MKNYHSQYFSALSDGLKNSKYYSNQKLVDSEDFFEKINHVLGTLKSERNKIYFFGNGASAAFANHMALDFSKNGGILSRSLSDSSLLTALANDYSYELALEQFLKIEGVTSKDLVITISSSGNSQNIIKVLTYCKNNSIPTLALSGLKPNNKSLSIADYSIYVPMKTYGMVECIHQIFLHLVLDRFMNIFEWDRDGYQNMDSTNFQL